MKNESKVKIGWYEADITPDEPIRLAGQFYERVSESIDSRLTCTALAVECGEEKFVLCSCDLVGVPNYLVEEAKRLLAGKLDVPFDNIIFSATHTHASYVLQDPSIKVQPLNYLAKRVPSDMPYVSLSTGKAYMSNEKTLAIISKGMAEAVLGAWNARCAASYQNAFGRVAVGMCRRACYDDGSAKMWGETNHANFTALEGGNDSGVELIYTFSEDGELTGVVANIACPAQVLEQRDYISSDYWGRVKMNLEKRFGRKIHVLGLCAAAGDQCPRDLIRWVEPETPVKDPNIKHFYPVERRADPSMYDKRGLDLVGKRIANEIVSVYEELPDERCDTAVLVCETLRVLQPLRRVTIREYEEAVAEIDAFIAANRGKTIGYEDSARLYIYAGAIERYEKQQTMNNYEIDVHIIRFGDIAIATNPYELFLDYGNIIRARSKAKQTFLVQLANANTVVGSGVGGYLPTRKAEEGSHYSAYVSSGYTGHEGGDILVRETVEKINRLF